MQQRLLQRLGGLAGQLPRVRTAQLMQLVWALALLTTPPGQLALSPQSCYTLPNHYTAFKAWLCSRLRLLSFDSVGYCSVRLLSRVLV